MEGCGGYMKHSCNSDAETIKHQFDCVCKMAMKNELIDYKRQRRRNTKHEIILSELSVSDTDKLFCVDEYSVENYIFHVFGYNIEVKDMLLAEALKSLSERKRNVVLLYYYMEMTDAEIAHEMKLVKSTIHEHRKKSLELLKRKMKGHAYEEEQQTDKKD